MGEETLAWFKAALESVEKIGLFRTLVILIALGTLIKIKEILSGLREILDTILTHHRELTRIRAKVERDKEKLAIALKGRRRKIPPAQRHPRP
jgi:hypothetical protein